MDQPAAMTTLKPDDFSAEQPQAFYLLDSKGEMEALSDATLVVQGARLPVHSQMLAYHSAVLCGLFVELRGTAEAPHKEQKPQGDAQEAARTAVEEAAERTAEQAASAQAGLVLEEPFRGSSLFDAALFLRFCYRPRDLAPASLAAVQGSLPALLRLAHKLDAPLIFQEVQQYMADNASEAATDTALLLDWATAADHCSLPHVRLRCVAELARRLASACGGNLAGAFVDAGLVAERCDKGILTHILALALAASPAGVAAPEEAEAALAQAANPGGFEWALDAFSQQPAGAGQAAFSPYFPAAGRRWRLRLYPGGESAEAAGHLSVFLEAEAPARARFGLVLVDQAAPGGSSEPQHIERSLPNAHAFKGGEGFGWHKFAALDRLRARPGYLAGDRLVLRARVEVVL